MGIRGTYRLRLALAMKESTECWIPPSSSSWTMSHVALYAPSQAALPAYPVSSLSDISKGLD